MLRSHLFTLFCVVFIAACAEDPQPVAKPIPIGPKNDILGDKVAGAVKNWFTKDSEKDGVEGVSADRSYQELGVRTGVQPIIVAVIDSGVDVSHEDLQGRIWVNKGEIPGDGIDNDGNGYVDDINGWNFLGSYDKNGKPVHVNTTTLEVTREVARYRKIQLERPLTDAEAAIFEKAKTEVEASRNDAADNLDTYSKAKVTLQTQYEILKDQLNVEFDLVTKDNVAALKPTTEQSKTAQTEMLRILNVVRSVARLNLLLGRFSDEVNFYYNENFDPRKQIIGDDQDNTNDHNYGNNQVLGPVEGNEHGTHVSGIIGALRNNGLGIDGVAADVRIMALRAVPNGDEYDKDIANAVRYATDNGARILNMSFGKGYSPLKPAVDAAFKYAASKNVLIIHSAGNDGKDNDVAPSFPNRYVAGSLSHEEIDNWVDVGASSANRGLTLPANFSNYGKVSVNLFSPGVDVESSIPGNQYAVFSGTSMAGPAAAGVAALVLSQHPELTGAQLKQLLMNSTRQYAGLMVNRPSDDGVITQVLFETLSISGGIVNAYKALKLVATQALASL